MCVCVCCRRGFESDRIEAVLHKIELSQRHQSDKFGLHLGIVSVLSKRGVPALVNCIILNQYLCVNVPPLMGR